ncbi:natural resistance-associated macrophage protein [Neolentinus lepideus HHB14362 ss-1]|uniref:Natural resistance-associated macrophage protein n=1 Tax=Neolentinus lepideus HHB14362 ss-1 TaxID=1314782 RepID=A0A165U449_9AGAM|nr:natural resistance-associated macrophage protein [Neolentinus lepideus HHB14362 ss-1]
MPETTGINVSQRPLTSRPKLRSLAGIIWHHATRHVGPGIVSSVAYFDPGNWGVDLQAGSQYGYKLLFIVLLSGVFAVFFQSVASKLGCVTGNLTPFSDLASHCRLLLYNRPRHTKLYRWLALYPLYVLTEIAIISTDLAELLGSAIALSLLFPSLPLWAGILITASDVFILLVIGDPLRGRPVKMFEWLITVLVLAVFVSMATIIARVHVDWGNAFDGFLPSKTIFQSGGLYTSIGIIGATVMPHSLFLGSFMATQDRVTSSKFSISVSDGSTDSLNEAFEDTSLLRIAFKKFTHSCISIFRIAPIEEDTRKSHSDHSNNPLSFVRAHLYHGIVDIVVSLIGFAVLINAFILILAGAVFYYGSGQRGSQVPASLFDAHALINSLVGKPAAVLFALALLCAGQSSSIIATIAGQVVCEGFIRWRVSPVLRRMLTRSLGLIPSMVVGIAAGRPGINTLLVASQVVLSIVLPFIVFPMIWLTSSKSVMEVRKPSDSATDPEATNGERIRRVRMDATDDAEGVQEQRVYFNNSKITAGIGYAIWLLIVIANVYVIVSLAMGKGS